MGITWNAEADAKLFAALIKCHNIKLDYQAMAQEMGPDCTAKAISHRITKLKTQAQGSSTDGTNKGDPSTPKSGRGRPAKENGTTTKPATGKCGRKAKKADEEDDVTSPVSPSIDRSNLRRSRSATVKAEHDNGSDEEDRDDHEAKRMKTEAVDGDSDAYNGTADDEHEQQA